VIVDIYTYFKRHPRYNKLVGDGYLFVEYKCPINAEEFELWTESHLITYVINGRKDWITESAIYKLQAGDSLFIKKGVYVTKQYLEEEYCVILFFLNDDFIKRFISEYSEFSQKIDGKKNLSQVFPIYSSDSFHSLVESIFHYLKQKESIPRSLVELKFKELLYNISQNPENKDIVGIFNAISISAKTNMEEIMTKHFRSDLNMTEYARLCGRSISTFKRDFSIHFNTTPSRWLKLKRLEYAKTLLLGSDMNINEVCFESGFKNNSHFVSAFKSKYKLPPGQFKAKYLVL
jgi:AraC-like DNA-binding protein